MPLVNSFPIWNALDHGVSKQQLDAYITGCICHSCPRCKTSLDDYLDDFMPGRRVQRERQARIEEHTVLAKHPARGDAEFTVENDHNPTVRKDCPRCDGSGQDMVLPIAPKMHNCPDCDGLGYTGRVVKYFANDEPILSVSPNQNGWVKCPCCNWRFQPADKFAWTGLRHNKCGQKLQIIETHEA